MKINTVIFDLDGTLLDTLDDLFESVNFALSDFNLPLKTKEEVKSAVGNGVQVLIKRVIPSGFSKEKELLDVFKRHYSNIKKPKTKPYEGIIELLNTLKSKGYKTGVVSNKFDSAVKTHCEKFFNGLIDCALGENEEEGIFKKPNPAGLLKTMDYLHCKKENSIYVGDSEVDIQTAQNAKVPCISVLWGFKDREFLIKNGASHLVLKPFEIYKMLNSTFI